MTFVPAPPSTNKIWTVSAGRMVRRKAYRRWMDEAVLLLRHGLPEIVGKPSIAVHIEANLDRRRDLDNVIKPILDALTKAGRIPDDRYIDHIEITRTDTPERGWCAVLATWR